MNTHKPLLLFWFFASLVLMTRAQPCTISINGNANVAFCQNQPATLTATTTGNPNVVWTSSPVGGISAGGTTLTPTVNTTNAPATYVLIVNGNNGQCLDTVTVVVNPVPFTPTFSTNPSSSQCSGTPITFTITNPLGNVTYSWNFGGGGTGSGTPVTHTYNLVGNGTTPYNVIVTSTFNGTGCSINSAPTQVQVKQKPKARLTSSNSLTTFFTGDTTFFKCATGAQTQTLFTFNNNANPNSGLSYYIDWGDGTTPFSQSTNWTSENHTYSIGIYILRYIVTNANGCSDTARYKVFFGGQPGGGIIGPGNENGCSPKQFYFKISGTGNNPPGTVYTVTFNDGSPPVTLSHPPPDSIPHTFTLTSCGTSSSDGTNIYTNAFSATFLAQNPCGTKSGSVLPIYISLPATSDFTITPSSTVCVNTVVTFNDITVGQDILPNGFNAICDSIPPRVWTISPSTGWTTSGTLGNTNGFVGANFDPYSWNPGSRNLPVTFNTAGTYTITMLSGNNCGPDTVVKTVCIQSPPNPSFTATPLTGCSPLVVNFNNTSTNVNQCGTITRQWIVNQTSPTCTQDSTPSFVYISGTNATSQNPVIRFNNAGTYTVQLRLTNVCGTFNSTTQTIRVRRKPELTISVTPNPICLGQTVTPSATVQNCDTPIVSYNWTFTGGTPASSTQLNPGSISYTTGGNKPISLTVQNACGSATANTSVTVNTPSSANAGPDQSVCVNSPNVQLNGTPSGGTWSGTNINPTTGVFTPSQTGTFNLVYTTGSGNCLGRDTMVMTVNPLPNISVTPSAPSICAGGNVTLTASGANSYTWSPTTGLNPTSGATVTASPNTTTTYTVTGTNTTTNCSASSTVTVTVNPIPTITNNPLSQTVCSGAATAAVSLTSPVTGTTYTWSGSSPNGVTGFPANGTSTSIPSFTPTNNGTTAGTITYSITPTANNCPGNPVTYTYTVNPRPVISPVSPQTICSGQSTTAVTPSANVTGTTFQWSSTVSGSVTGNTASGNGNIPVQTLTNSGTTAGTVTYTITPTANNCQGNPTNFVVTVNPTPVISPINNQTICSGQNTTAVNPTSNVSGTTYQWSSTVSGSITGNVASGTGSIPAQTLTNSGTTAGTVTFTITPTANNCPGSPVSYTVTVNPIPQATATPSTATICSGTATNIQLTSNVSNATFSWTVSAPASITGASNGNGNSIQQTLTNSSSTTQTVTYTITPSANNCNGTPITVTITVSAGVTISFSPTNQIICSGQSTQLVNITSNPSGATLNWTSQANGIGGVAASGTNTIPVQTLTNNTNAPLTAAYNVSVSISGCNGPVASYSITVNPIPSVTLPSAQTVCSGTATAAVNLTSSVSGTTYTWSGTSPNGVTGFPANGTSTSIPSFAPTNNGTTAGTITYSITPTANNCPGNPVTYTYTVNPRPVISPVSPQTICSGQSTTSVTLSANVTGTTFQWTSTVSGSITGNTASGNGNIPVQTLTNSGTTAGTVTYAITPTANNCPGNPVNFVVTVNPTPVITSINNQTICSGQNTTAVNPSSNVSGTTYQWSSTASPNVTGNTASGTGSIPAQTLTNSGTTAGTVTYTITPTANNCPGSPVSYAVTVNPIPQATATPSTATICSGTTTNIQLTSNVSNTTFSWTVSAPASITGASSGNGNSIQQTLTNSSSTTQTVTYTITPSANNCNGTPIIATITVNPGVSINFAPNPQAICSGQTSQAVTISSPTSGVSITWTSQANGAGGVAPSGTTTIPAQTLTNTTNSPIQVIYAAVADYAGCITQPFNYIITVNPIPTVTNTPLAQTVCEGVPTQQINLTSAVSGATFTWSASSPNGITGFAASGSGIAIAPQTLNNPADTAGTVVYTITPNANNCAGPASQYVITVNPTPNIILPTSQTICNGDTSQVVSITSNVANTTFSWQSSAPSGVSGNTPIGTGNIPQQILVNSNSNAAIVTYIITATANGCSNTSTYNITINPSPSVTFSLPPQTVCSGSSTALVSLSSSTTGASISWTANVPSGITGATLSGTNTIPVQTLINNTFQPLTITYTAQAVTSGIVCPGTTSNYTITVNPTPDVSATPMTDTICSATPTNIQISSNVSGTIFTWSVNPPNGVTGASAGTGNTIVQTLSNNTNNPLTVTYNIQTNATNCPGQSVSVNVVVNPSPVVQFSLPNQTICSGFTTQQVNISSPTVGASISWTSVSPSAVTGALANGGNTIPPQTLFNSSNIAQQVQYTASVNFSNCPGIANAYVITVNPTPHITNTDTIQTVCSGDSTTPITLLSDVANTTFSWSGTANSSLTGYLPNGTSNPIPSQSISNSTNQSDTVYFTVTPTAAGCVGPSEIFKIAVNPRPVISLTPDSQSICTNNQSLPINISSNISTTSFSWSSVSQWVSGAIPNGTGNLIPHQGLYNTSPIADTGYVIFNVSPTAGGCPGQDISAYIQVNPTPVVNFAMNVNNGCSPLHVSFATNTLTYGKPDSLVFNWGDGTPNTVLFPNPIQPIWSTVQHVFVNNTFNAVTYTISLTANNECGDTTVYQTVTVQPNVIDAFFTPSVTQGCEPLTVSFADFSTGATFTSWCFNYNTTSDTCLGASVVVQPGTTVSHTFSAGTYTVALYITDGCSQDTAFGTIQVSPSPTADFTYDNNVCKNAPVTFTQQSSPAPGTFLTAYQWFFGDGDSAIGSSIIHTYDSANIYNACLVVSASNGCSTTVCKPVTILSKPIVDFTAYDTCVNTQPIQFSNTSVGANFYQWDFGDGNTSILVNPGNSFLTPGTYTVTLIGSTNFCSDTNSHPVIIYPKPTASFLTPATYICGVPANASLSNTSSGALGYAWNFGNNTTSTATNPIAVFSTPGTFNIQLVAANQFNCYDTATHPIDIYPFPSIQSIDIQPAEGCQPLQITVTANATNGNLYIWNFGDGTSNLSLTTPSATYTYSDTGTYTISVWVYSQADCGDTVILYDTVKVHINPIADFDFLVNTTVEPIDGTVIFTNTSQHAETYFWDFGDGFSSTVESPSHHYETVDSFYATLYAYNHFGCVDSISKSFFVFKRSLWVPNAFAPDFGGGNDLVKIWKPVGIGIRNYRAQVFNTWGELLWESTKLEETQPAEGWDGTYRGNMCHQDVYVWKVEAVFMDGVRWDGMTYETGGKKKTIGSVTLVR